MFVFFQASLRQMNQTRFYIVENKNRAVQVNLLIVGLPPLLTKEEYVQLIQEHLTVKSESEPVQTSPELNLLKYFLKSEFSLHFLSAASSY